MEYDRLTIDPKLRNVVDNTDLDEEEVNATLDGQLLSSLVGVVSEIDLNEATLGSLYELKAFGQKSKKSLNKKSSRAGCSSKIKNCVIMNGMFSNSRGLRDLAKHLYISHCVKDHNLDFIAISETGRRDFSQRLLDRLSGGVDFEWTSKPPRGRSGGILLGERSDTMEVIAQSGGDYHIKLHLRNRADNFIWSLVVVYGAAQDEFKADFLPVKFRSAAVIEDQFRGT
jgi:hypothetical protein